MHVEPAKDGGSTFPPESLVQVITTYLPAARLLPVLAVTSLHGLRRQSLPYYRAFSVHDTRHYYPRPTSSRDCMQDPSLLGRSDFLESVLLEVDPICTFVKQTGLILDVRSSRELITYHCFYLQLLVSCTCVPLIAQAYSSFATLNILCVLCEVLLSTVVVPLPS